MTLLLEVYWEGVVSIDGLLKQWSDGSTDKQTACCLIYFLIYLLGLLVCSCAPRLSWLPQCIISSWSVLH